MAEWIYFIHPPRDNFAETMTHEEKAVWGVHFERFDPVNTGIAVSRRRTRTLPARSWRRIR